MNPLLKNIMQGIFVLLMAAGFSVSAEEKKATAAPREIMVWVSPESPPRMWLKGYGEVFPVDYMFRKISEAGYTDVEFQEQETRGPAGCYHNTRVQYASRCSRMGNRDWLEEALAAADKYNLKIWLTLTPSYKVEGTDIVGLDDPRHIKIWADLVEEYGKNYKPRHKSLVGIYLHEVNCAEAPDMHRGDQEKFSSFCEKKFGEKYSAASMPEGKGNTKWDKRFYLYKNEAITHFTRIMRETAAKYNMETIFCLYPPETSSNSAVWGYDTVALEKNSDRLWVVIQAEYRDLKNVWQDTGQGYKGSNVPYRETMAFHGKPVSVFESRFILFPEVMRNYYRQYGNFSKIHGDILNGYLQKSEKIVKLFTGVENVKKWNHLHKEWIGAESQARIAVIASSVPLVLRFPNTAGLEYRKVFTSLLDFLKTRYPVDAQVAGTEFTLNPENLLKYDLIIIPEEMGIGLDKAFLESLKEYIAKGGKILALGTPVTTGSSDLEIQEDHTDELFGIQIKDAPFPGYVALESKKFSVAGKKMWGNSRDIKVSGADEIIISNRVTGKPVMTRKGNAYYFAFGYNGDNGKLFTEFIDKIVPQPVYLNNNTGFRFSSITTRDNMLCAALPCEKASSADLVLDTRKLGLKGDRVEFRNIITGKTVCTVNAAEMQKGIKLKTDYDSEPYVLVIGPDKSVAQFKGIYPDSSVFADMGKISLVENPEVAIAVPDKPGIKVGIYQNAHGAEEIYSRLDKIAAFNCFYLPRLDNECMAHADVIIVPQAKSSTFFNNGLKEVREMVRRGKGFILTHDAALCAKEIFPDLIKENHGKVMRVKDDSIKIALRHPAAENLKVGDEYTPGFAFDHYTFIPGKDARAIAKDSQGNDVVLAGGFGKGNVVIFGTLPGMFCSWDDCGTFLKDKKLEGRELQLLIDSVQWLAGDKK